MNPCYGQRDRAPYTVEQLEALALAMFMPGERCQYIDVHNNADGWAGSVQEAVRSGRPFMGRCRDDVFNLDHDEEPVVLDDFIEEFLGDYEPVVDWSGQGDRQHLSVVVDDPLHRQALLDQAKQFGFRDVQFGRWLRPPGSPHRLGGFSRLVDGMSPEEAVRRLFRLPRSLGLGHRASQALFVGAGAFESGDRSSSMALVTATTGMVNAGYDDDQMWSLLRANPGGEKITRKIDEGEDPVEVRRWWQHRYVTGSRERVRLNPMISSGGDADEFIARVTRWMKARRWKGVGGANQRAALTALLKVAAETHSVHDLGMSQRQLAELAGLTDRTVAKSALDKLIGIGIIEVTPMDQRTPNPSHSGVAARSYTLRAPSNMTPDERAAWFGAGDDDPTSLLLHQSHTGGVRMIGEVVDIPQGLGHDAFHRRGLGPTKLNIWNVLDPVVPSSTRQVAEALKYSSTSTPREHLKSLAVHGMAIKTSHGWLRLDPDLDEVSRVMGTHGVGEALQRKHRAERAKNNRRVFMTAEEKFVRDHIRRGTRSHAIDQRALRSAFYSYCSISYFTTKEVRQPGPDLRLLKTILDQRPGAEFEDAGSHWTFLRGRWTGIRLIGRPRDELVRLAEHSELTREVALPRSRPPPR